MILTALMAHPRKLVRKAVIARLMDATAAGDRVTGTRVEPHRKTGLPAISVYSLREPIDLDASSQTAPRELVRELKIEIAGWVAHSEAVPVDDAMDDLAEQIEAAMDEDEYLGDGTSDARAILEETVMQIVEDDGHSDPLIGIVALTYSVTYRTQQGDMVVDDFLRADTKQQIVGGVSDTPKAEDTFNVRSP